MCEESGKGSLMKQLSNPWPSLSYQFFPHIYNSFPAYLQALSAFNTTTYTHRLCSLVHIRQQRGMLFFNVTSTSWCEILKQNTHKFLLLAFSWLVSCATLLLKLVSGSVPSRIRNSLDFWPSELLLGASLTGLTSSDPACDYHAIGRGPRNLRALWMLRI